MESGIRLAANALIVHDRQALLVEFEDATGRHLNFPGGGVEVGETLRDAVAREVLEETSLAVNVERLLLIVECTGSHSRNWSGERQTYVPWNEVRFFFLATPAEPASNARLPDRPDDDQIAVRWVELALLARERILPAVTEPLLDALSRPGDAPSIVTNPTASWNTPPP